MEEPFGLMPLDDIMVTYERDINRSVGCPEEDGQIGLVGNSHNVLMNCILNCRVCKELAAIKAATKADRSALKNQIAKKVEEKDELPASKAVQIASDTGGVKVVLG